MFLVLCASTFDNGAKLFDVNITILQYCPKTEYMPNITIACINIFCWSRKETFLEMTIEW